MAMIKYDVSNVEAGGGGEQPQPGLYKGKIVSCTNRKKKASGDAVSDLEVIVDVGSDYARLWTYVKLPDDPNYNEAAHGWKMREFTDAMGLPPKGQFDPKAQEGKPVTVKVAADTDLEGGYRGKIKNLFKPGSQDEDDEADGDSGGVALTTEELADWDDDDLKAELKERGLSIGRFSRAKAIEALAEDEPEEDDDEPEASSNGAAGDLDPELLAELKPEAEYYEEWSDDDIKTFVSDLGIEGNIAGRKTRQKLVSAIVSLAESMGNGDSAAAEGEGDDYDEWPDEDLSDEITTRNEQGAEIKIAGRKTKDKMIAALRADDSSGEPF